MNYAVEKETVFSIGDILAFPIQCSKKIKSQRLEILEELYNLYTSNQEKVLRKKTNWKNYIVFLKSNRIESSKQQIEKFKKSKSFIKEHDIKTFSILVNKKTGQGLHKLYIMLSVSKDKFNRKECISSYILFNEKRNLEKN